ncbi:MAG: hypothetical protein ACR2KM_11390 [Gemmatimonadaceae bacterium]
MSGAVMFALAPSSVLAQDNYEIQVYGSETVLRGSTMVELHSNFTASGRRAVEDMLFPTQHAVHETLEITHGFSDIFQVGFYVFTSARSGQGYQWVGDHIRPRIRAPDSWHLPVGLSLSAEVGYQRREFSADTWSLELRPIIDKQFGRWYVAVNPTLDRSLRGENVGKGFGFAPNVTVTADANHTLNLGVEYYGAFGPVTRFDPVASQQHQLFGVVNLNLDPRWEFNAGIGDGFTSGSDHLIFKLILGRRFGR